MAARIIIKQITLQLCTATATFTGNKTSPAILMYHSFDTQNWKHGVSPEMLTKQIKYLVKHKTIVSLPDIVSYAKGEKELSNNAVAVTIDDGYADTYSVLFPLAKKYNIPFTIFLTSNLSPQPKLGNLSRPTWAQLKEMSDSGLVDVQVHGHTHVNFPEIIQNNIQKEEIENSRNLIETKLGIKPSMVAYPAGRYNEEVQKYLDKNNYIAALTTRIGFVKLGDDTQKLNRIVVDRNTSMLLFKLRLLSGLPIYMQLVRLVKR